MKFFRKNKKGFTLTELMVVVVILGILVAIAVPVYNNLTEQATTNADETNIRTLTSMVTQFAAGEQVGMATINIVPTVTYVNGDATSVNAFATATYGIDDTAMPDSADTDTIPDLIEKYIVEWPVQPDKSGSYQVIDGEVSRLS